jgi:hypothetical protein
MCPDSGPCSAAVTAAGSGPLSEPKLLNPDSTSDKDVRIRELDSVSFSLHPHLTPKHAEQKDEVSDRKNHT